MIFGDDVLVREILRQLPLQSYRGQAPTFRIAPGDRAEPHNSCLQSSAPIEPPAPVTMTDLPRMHEAKSLGVRRHRVAAEKVGT